MNPTEKGLFAALQRLKNAQVEMEDGIVRLFGLDDNSFCPKLAEALLELRDVNLRHLHVLDQTIQLFERGEFNQTKLGEELLEALRMKPK